MNEIIRLRKDNLDYLEEFRQELLNSQHQLLQCVADGFQYGSEDKLHKECLTRIHEYEAMSYADLISKLLVDKHYEITKNR